MAVTTYHVRVERGDRYWLVHVVELDRWTQARTLRDVEPMARDLVATMADVAPDSFELTTDIALPDEVSTHLKQAEQLREQSRQAQADPAAVIVVMDYSRVDPDAVSLAAGARAEQARAEELSRQAAATWRQAARRLVHDDNLSVRAWWYWRCVREARSGSGARPLVGAPHIWITAE